MNVRNARWLDSVGKVGFAWPTLLLAVVAVGGFLGLGVASARGWVPYVIAIPVQAFLAFASFTPMHDASHKAIAPGSRWIDEVVGWVCGVPVLAAFSGLKYLHLEHHRFTNDLQRDPDAWSSKAKSRLGIVLRWLVLDLHYLARYVSEARTRPRRELVSCGVGVAVMVGGWVVMIASGYGVELVLCWLVPSRIAIVMLSVFFDWIPHAPRHTTVAEDPYRASNVYEHRWLSPVLLAQNYHLVHHLFPGVPFYRYGAVYWRIRDELLARGADVRRIGRRPPRVASPGLVVRVTRVIDETDDTRTFELAGELAYVPGQFIVVHVPLAVPVKRCYSISRADGTLAITVKRQGVASTWLHAHATAGSELRIDPPAGQFVLGVGDRPLACFAAGSGITPIIALVEEAVRRGRRVTLVYANRDRAQVIFRARLEALADRITLVMHDDTERGRIDEDALAPYVDAEVYACGPPGFLDLVERVAPHARTERFVRREVVQGGPAATRYVGIREGQRHAIDVVEGETLLVAARRAGLAPRASCEEGYCGTCAARVTCGRVAGDHGPLTDAELARGFVLPCRAHALSGEPVVIDFDAPREAP